MTNNSEIIKRNLIRAMKQMSDASPRIAFEMTPQAIRYETDLPHPLFNRVISYSGMESAGAAADIAAIAAHYRAAGLPFSWLTWLHDAEAAKLKLALEREGLARAGGMTGMALSLADWTYDTPTIPNFEIRSIRTASDLVWFEEVVLPAFGLQGEAGALFMQMNARSGIGEHAACRHYVGFADGRPAGAATAFLDGETIGIYNVATAEAYRRRGIGSAVTAHAVREGQAAGARLAVLQSSELGHRVYRELGFRDEVAIELFLG